VVDRLNVFVGVERDRARLEAIHHSFEKQVRAPQAFNQPAVLNSKRVVVRRVLDRLLEFCRLPRLIEIGVDMTRR
jgi:hypothetical protein